MRKEMRKEMKKEGPMTEGKFSKKNCRFCVEPDLTISYKDVKALKYFMTERERILPRRITGLCAYHQRQLTQAIKKARILSLVPFSSSQRQLI